MKKNDEVNHPQHYTSGKIEALEIIEDVTRDLEGLEAFAMGSALKYLVRFNKKKDPIQDLEKAVFYINRIINLRLHEINKLYNEGDS
jgi:hypothetical protein|tara:strand:+ start:193 stop:453 length:261 start_codon:yes stop_codon:yes gene_type:complete